MLCSQKIVDRIGLISAVNKELVEVRFNSSCIGKNWKETSTCDGLHLGSEVGFIAKIKVIVVFIISLACE